MKYLITILMSVLSVAAVASAELAGRLQIPSAELLLSSAAEPLAKRESSFSPQEFIVVQELTPLIEQQRYAEALQVLAAREPEQEQPYSPAMLFVRAQLSIQQEDFATAERDLKSAIAKLPDFMRGHQALAILYLIKERWPEAKLALAKAISLGGGTAQLYGQLAYIHMRDDDLWAAIAAFQQALMLDPKKNAYQRGLLVALTRAKQLPAALSLLESLLADNPDQSTLWLLRANIALQMNDEALALSSLEVAVRLGDGTRENQLVAAQLHMSKANYQRATELLDRNLKGSNWNYGSAGKILAWLEHEQQWRHLDKLLKTLRSQLKTMSAGQRSDYHLYRGKLAIARNQLKNAAKAYRAAVAADPANGRALLAHAELLREQNQLSRAELLYTRAQTIAEVRERALMGQAQLFIDRKDYPAALKVLRNAYSEYPENHGLRENIATLTRITQVQ